MKHATIILKRKRDREISLEMLSEQELEQIAALTAYDEYALDEYVFSVLGNEIKITDEVIDVYKRQKKRLRKLIPVFLPFRTYISKSFLPKEN